MFVCLFVLQECQNLLDENRKLMKLNGTVMGNGNGSIPNQQYLNEDMSLGNGGVGCGGNTVEEVVLQTQIETLQWQLNQVKFTIAKK